MELQLRDKNDKTSPIDTKPGNTIIDMPHNSKTTNAQNASNLAPQKTRRPQKDKANVPSFLNKLNKCAQSRPIDSYQENMFNRNDDNVNVENDSNQISLKYYTYEYSNKQIICIALNLIGSGIYLIEKLFFIKISD